MKIILGSGSPYRRQLLRELGYEFEVVSPEIDERAIRHADPAVLALALSEAKSEAVARQLSEPALVITADQVVAQAGEIREKPDSEEQARFYLRTAADAPVETISAVTVLHIPSGKCLSGIDRVSIQLAPLPDEVIDRLIAQGEVFHCAGGMKIEDPDVAPYVLRISGDLDSVMGLPKKLTAELIARVIDAVGES